MIKPVREDPSCMSSARYAWVHLLIDGQVMRRRPDRARAQVFKEAVDLWLDHCEQVLYFNHRDLFTDLEPPK